MRIAALYDIHGNLPALEAVLDEITELDIDRVVIGGDVVPGPMGSECLARLTALDLPVSYLYGNGEVDTVAAHRGESLTRVPVPFQEGMRWVADRLDPKEVESIGSWPKTCTIDVPGLGRVLFCHATPVDEHEIFTRITPEDELLPAFEALDADLVVCGHTHMPFDRTVGGLRVVNAGSVGMPFGEPGAHWLLLDGSVSPRRTDYDTDAATARIRGTGYPNADLFRLVDPRPAEEMTELFERGRRV